MEIGLNESTMLYEFGLSERQPGFENLNRQLGFSVYNQGSDLYFFFFRGG